MGCLGWRIEKTHRFRPQQALDPPRVHAHFRGKSSGSNPISDRPFAHTQAFGEGRNIDPAPLDRSVCFSNHTLMALLDGLHHAPPGSGSHMLLGRHTGAGHRPRTFIGLVQQEGLAEPSPALAMGPECPQL